MRIDIHETDFSKYEAPSVGVVKRERECNKWYRRDKTYAIVNRLLRSSIGKSRKEIHKKLIEQTKHIKYQKRYISPMEVLNDNVLFRNKNGDLCDSRRPFDRDGFYYEEYCWDKQDRLQITPKLTSVRLWGKSDAQKAYAKLTKKEKYQYLQNKDYGHLMYEVAKELRNSFSYYSVPNGARWVSKEICKSKRKNVTIHRKFGGYHLNIPKGEKHYVTVLENMSRHVGWKEHINDMRSPGITRERFLLRARNRAGRELTTNTLFRKWWDDDLFIEICAVTLDSIFD